jgi:putative phage-type endonuclease
MSDTNRKFRNRVKALQKKPQPEQRTPEWFRERQTRITASEAASCLYKSQQVCEPYVKEFAIQNYKYKENEPLNPYETKEDYIIKKVSSYFGEATFKDTVFTLWGKKYEDVANRLYAKLYNTKVLEFGLLSHNMLKWVAASPDGITEDGVMIEIKCPKARKIDANVPPLYYWVQVQMQLEVCNLDYCDFLECEIVELPCEEDFINKPVLEKQDKGIILKKLGEGEPQYIYPPVHLTTVDDYISWKKQNMELYPNALEPKYYFISKYNVMRIKRSKEWFASVRHDIKKTWDVVRKLQNNYDDFLKYKESIHLIKNREYIARFNDTECIINDHDSTFVFDRDFVDDLDETSITLSSDKIQQTGQSTVCMID